MIEEKDLSFITKILDNRYRKVEECDKIAAKSDERQGIVEVTVAKLSTKLDILISILATIAVPIAGVCVKYLFGGK